MDYFERIENVRMMAIEEDLSIDEVIDLIHRVLEEEELPDFDNNL